jgi:hypothetical protein
MDEEMAMNDTGADIVEPIIINLGKKKRKQIKRLKKGRGKLWRDVIDVIDEVGEQMNSDSEGKTIVPVILIYKEKPKRGGRGRLPRFYS